MKKIKFLGAAILAASLIFAGCANGSDDDVDSTPDTEKVVDEKGGEGSEENGGSESGSGEEAGGEENSGEGQNSGSGESSGSGDSGSSSGGESSGSGDSEDAGDGDSGDEDEDTNEYTAPDLTDYFKYELVSSPKNVATNKLIGNWGAGSEATPNDDGTWTITSSDSMWNGVGGICAPFTGFEAGTFANYDYIVFTVDTTDFEIDNTDDGPENKGVNVKIAAGTMGNQKDVSSNYVANGNVRTYYVPMTTFGANDPSAAVEFAIIIGGSGTLKLNEVYFASAEDPTSKPVTAISITPASANVEAGGSSTFVVKDSNFADVTASAIFDITGEASEGCSIENGVFTAGATGGNVTITAKYTVNGKEYTASANVMIVVKATTSKELLDPTSEGFKLDNILPFVNTVAWGGTNTSPVAEQVNGVDSIVCTVPDTGIGGWGISAAWQGGPEDKISLVGYDSISITVKDEFGVDKSLTSAKLKIKAADEVEGNTIVSEPDADGWRTITASLSQYSSIDLGAVVCIHLVDWADAPAAGGKLYISKVTLNPASEE